MGNETSRIAKPMISVGNRPILWHIMEYYAAWGHTDFILCLGYKAESIKQYFLAHREALTNDFILSQGGRDVELLGSDVSGWRITFVETGVHATIGDRLLAVAPHLGGDEHFLATYSDGLTDAPLDEMIGHLTSAGKTGLFLAVRPCSSVHVVDLGVEGVVRSIESIQGADVWINGGFFVLHRRVLEEISPGEELVEGPFQRLIAREEVIGYRYEGFWGPMDTIKDRQRLDALSDSGTAPWRKVGSQPLAAPILRALPATEDSRPRGQQGGIRLNSRSSG